MSKGPVWLCKLRYFETSWADTGSGLVNRLLARLPSYPCALALEASCLAVVSAAFTAIVLGLLALARLLAPCCQPAVVSWGPQEDAWLPRSAVLATRPGMVP